MGVTTTSRREAEWLTNDVGRIFPQQWERFASHIPASLNGVRIVDAYASLLFDEDPAVSAAARHAGTPNGLSARSSSETRNGRNSRSGANCSADMAYPQIGIFSLGENAQAHFELNLRSSEHAKDLARSVLELDRPHSTVSGVNLVAGFRPSLWAQMHPDHALDARDFDEPITGADGYTMPATQRDAWLWFTGASYDAIFDQARAALKMLANVADVAFEVSGWAYRHSRDLTGFEDGTANPSLLEAPSIALVPDGERGGGSTIVLLQQWQHHMHAFETLDEHAQERVIGRTKRESDELTEDEMPEDSHVARTELHDAQGNELPIFRRSVPYGNVGAHGLMFVGFAREQQRLHTMLRRMAGAEGPRDALTRYSTALTGSYYVVPSIDALTSL